MISITNNLTAIASCILQGRRARRETDSSSSCLSIIDEPVRDEEYVLQQRQLTLDILEGRRPLAHAAVTLTEHFVVREEEATQDEQTRSRIRQETLEILEGSRPPPMARCTYSEFAAWLGHMSGGR